MPVVQVRQHIPVIEVFHMPHGGSELLSDPPVVEHASEIYDPREHRQLVISLVFRGNDHVSHIVLEMMYREDKVRLRRIHQFLREDLLLHEGLFPDGLSVQESCRHGHLFISLMEMLIDYPLLVPVMRKAQEHVFKPCVNGSIFRYLTETVFDRIRTRYSERKVYHRLCKIRSAV